MDKDRMPLSECWGCGAPLDGAMSATAPDDQVSSGAISFCVYCGVISVFGEDLMLTRPTKWMLDVLMQDRELQVLVARLSLARLAAMAGSDRRLVAYVG